MYPYELANFRRRLEAGETLDLEDQLLLIRSATELTRAARLPAEFLIRVHRDQAVNGWAAEHPLFLVSIAARHPADAVIRAGLELRRVLERDFPEFTDEEPEQPRILRRRRINEDAWDALTRLEPGPETVAALQAAMEALEEARQEATELRYGDTLRRVRLDRDASPEERAAARDELRRHHATRLTALGIEAADVSWSEQAFGPAASFGIELPVLVAGFKVPSDWPDEGVVEEQRFANGRWMALEHRWDNDDVWNGDPKHVRLIAQPLQATPDAELRLRRLAEAAPSGMSVGHHVAYDRAVAEHLPTVSVEHVEGWISPAALPIDAASLEHLVTDPPELTNIGLWLWNPCLYWLSDLPGDRR